MKPRGSHDARQGKVGTQAKHSPKETHWENVADWYDKLVGDQGSEYHQHVIIPGVLRMLDLKSGERGSQKILDIACGQGVLCRAMAGEGANVTGLDAAGALIEAAKKRGPGGIDYLVGDARKLEECGLEKKSYDAITCILAIQNITPLSPVWQGCKVLLKSGGKLIVVMMHPCFRIPRQSGWHWDEAKHEQVRTVTQYLTSGKTEIQMNPGKASAGSAGEITTTFHRPLQAYVNTLGSAGLLIDQVGEWASHKSNQPGPKKEALEKSRKEIPMFLALRTRAG